MFVCRVLSRVSRSAGLRSLVAPRTQHIAKFSGQTHSLVRRNTNKLVAAPVSLLNHATLNVNGLRRFSVFSSFSTESKDDKSNMEATSIDLDYSSSGS